MENENIFWLDFSKEDIFRYLVYPFQEYDNVVIRISNEDDEVLPADSDEKIMFICYDGDKEILCINLYGFQVSLFFLNEEIMFIDDSVRMNICSSDTQDNIVYNGQLCTKTQEEILLMISNLMMVLLDVSEVKINETRIDNKGWDIPMYDYELVCRSRSGKEVDYEVENIKIKIR